MTTWKYMIDLHKVCRFTSRERPPGAASNSELKRWLQNKAIKINGTRPGPNDEMEFPVNELVLFPKSAKNKITIF